MRSLHTCLASLLAAALLVASLPLSVAAADPLLPEENLALGCKTRVSTVYGGADAYSPVQLTDGDVGHLSRWAAAEEDTAAWCQVALGRAAGVDRVLLLEDTVYGQRVSSISLSYWDGADWVPLEARVAWETGTDGEGRSYRLYTLQFALVYTTGLQLELAAEKGPAIRELAVENTSGSDLTAREITLDGQPLEGFSPTRFTYDVVVPGARTPTVACPNGQVTQAAAFSGAATVTVSEGTVSNIYTIHFYQEDGFMVNTVWDAHKYSAISGASQNASAPDGSAVGNFTAGGYLAYGKVDFGDGQAKTFMATLCAGSAGVLELRLDAPDGALIGTLQWEQTAAFREFYGALEPATGVHTLYLVSPAAAAVSLDTFVLSSYHGAETAEETEARMAWFREARYGEFIHFGAYANFPFAPDFTGYGEWVMYNQKISRVDYEQLCVSTFNPTEFDAETIVANAQAAGARYMVFTSKHHEGFSMYDTDIAGFAGYDLMDYGLYQGEDPIAGLSAACQEAGIRFGCYYSIMDWHHATQSDLGARISDKAAYVADMKGQLRELIQKYDVDLLWFDGEWNDWWTEEDGQELYTYLRTLKPSLIINNRVGKRNRTDGDYGTPEQEIPANGLDYDWESCITMNDSWGYVAHDTNWKSPQWIIESLVNTSSKGGNMLLNVGPDPTGVVPESCLENMRVAGAWLEAYGESIYGTTASPFSSTLSFGAATKREGKLYLHVLQFPEDGKLLVPAISNQIRCVSALGQAGALGCTAGNGFLEIDLSGVTPVEYDTVIVLEVEGIPTQAADSYLNHNLALTATATADDVYFGDANYDGAKAADGDSSTRWATGDGITAAALTLDFPADTAFNTVTLEECTDWGARVQDFVLEYWDGSSWQTAAAATGMGSGKTLSFAPVTTTRLRLRILNCLEDISGGPSIRELAVYNLDLESSTPVQQIQPGDLNADGSLSVTDVVLLRKAILNGGFAPVGDLNRDGALSVTDVVLLRKAILAEKG